MANAIYPAYKNSLLQGDADTALTGSGTTGLYVALLNNTYSYNAAHQFYSSISAAVVGTPQEITGVTTAGGLIDGADVIFPAVSGAEVVAFALYRRNAGADTTWRLVAFIDTGQTGLPVTPNGGDIEIAWSASGIIQL